MSETYQGSCMCGSVRFTWTGRPRFVSDCVCDSCRRAHGAAVVTWAGGEESQFHLDEGEAVLTWYHSSPASERGFCSACGTRLLFRSSKWPGELHVALASVAAPHDLHSTGVAFVDEFPAWTAVQTRPETG